MNTGSYTRYRFESNQSVLGAKNSLGKFWSYVLDWRAGFGLSPHKNEGSNPSKTAKCFAVGLHSEGVRYEDTRVSVINTSA